MILLKTQAIVTFQNETKNNYNYNELIECANGNLFGEGNARLPAPPMLMFDRITQIKSDEGKFKKGIIKAELDIK